MGDATVMLAAVEAGDSKAAERLLVLVYDELRRLGASKMAARVAGSYVSSEENNTIFGRPQSFVTGPPTNGVQFMVKDSKKYASTGGWGVRSFQRRQTCRRGNAPKLLSPPPGHQISRLYLHPLLTLILRTTAKRNETITTLESTAKN